MCYDVTRRETFENLVSLFQRIRQQCPDALILLVGNKSDCESERQVSTKWGKDFGENLEIPFFETSSAKYTDVETVFQVMTSLILEQR